MRHNNFVTIQTKQKHGSQGGMGKGINDLFFRTILGSGLFLKKLLMLPFQEAVSILNSNWPLSYDHTRQPDYETAEGRLLLALPMQNISRCSPYLWGGWTDVMDKSVSNCPQVVLRWNQILDSINWTELGTIGWETPQWKVTLGALSTCTA